MKPVSSFLTGLNFSDISHELFFWLILLVVWACTFFFGWKTVSSYQKSVELVKNNNNLKETLSLLTKSSNISVGEIDQFNNIAANLIPERESYFSIINALDALSQKTGFIFGDYEINLSDSNQEKLSLNVNGKGNIDTLHTFLQEYKFISGRLITINSLDLLAEDQDQYSLTLNFYHQSASSVAPADALSEPDVSVAPLAPPHGNQIGDLISSTLSSPIQGETLQLSEKDIRFVREIIAQIKE